MTERSMAFDQVIRTQLRFTGSEGLRDAVSDSLVKPELRREFAQRSFYLYLRTETPVEVTYHYGELDQPLYSKDPLDEYNAGIALRHKGKDLYRNHYQLSSRIVGGAEYETPHPGISLLFQVAMNEYERGRLLSPPFDGVAAGPVYATHEIHEAWLTDANDRGGQYQDLRTALGVYHPEIQEGGYLSGKYYLTHPEAIARKSPYRNGEPSRDSAAS